MITISIGLACGIAAVAVIFIIIAALWAHSRAEDQNKGMIDMLCRHFDKEREALEAERKDQVSMALEAGKSMINQIRADYDPKTGVEAKKLITRGVRKANKANRLKQAKRDADWVQKLNHLHTKRNIMAQAILNTCTNKIKLPAVREKFVDSFYEEHKRLMAQLGEK